MANPSFEIRPAVLMGETAEVQLHHALRVLRGEGLHPKVIMELAPLRPGILCGIQEVNTLLARVLPEGSRQVWSLAEGSEIEGEELCLRVEAPYAPLGLYETAIRGILAHCTGWATAASECVWAASPLPVISFGASRVHPGVAAIMDYSAIVGGCSSCASVLGARLSGTPPFAKVPPVFLRLLGGPVRAAQAFDQHIAPDVPRVAVLEPKAELLPQALEVAQALREHLRAVLVDHIPGVRPVDTNLVRGLRQGLNAAGFQYVEVVVAGDVTPELIRELARAGAPVNAFGVGGYIAAADPIEFTASIREAGEEEPAPGGEHGFRLQRVM